MQQRAPRSRRARYARRHSPRPKGPVIDVSTYLPAPLAGPPMRLFRWSCEGCGAKGEAVISKPANLNLLAAAQGRPGVTGIDANLLPNRSDASTIAAAHRRHSPRCSLQPVVDLRSEGEQLADASPAQPSGGAA